MPGKLVVCFDGTWNAPDEGGDARRDAVDCRETNVVRIYRSICGEDTTGIPDGGCAGPAPVPTLKWYDRGVGTRWYGKLAGGAFGFGICRNIREGYKFLVDHHEPDDEIYLFGFSRGAYAARSLVGLIRNCGSTSASASVTSVRSAMRRTRGCTRVCRRGCARTRSIGRRTRGSSGCRRRPGRGDAVRTAARVQRGAACSSAAGSRRRPMK